MRTRLALTTTLLGWILLQLPLVVCASPCRGPRSTVLLAGHSCHDEEAPEHRSCCCSHDHGRDRTKISSERADAGARTGAAGPVAEDGDTPGSVHVLVQRTICADPPPPALPAPAVAADAWISGVEARHPARAAWTSEGRHGPPRPGDLAFASDRLLL